MKIISLIMRLNCGISGISRFVRFAKVRIYGRLLKNAARYACGSVWSVRQESNA